LMASRMNQMPGIVGQAFQPDPFGSIPSRHAGSYSANDSRVRLESLTYGDGTLWCWQSVDQLSLDRVMHQLGIVRQT
jgi:hypothetical protein